MKTDGIGSRVIGNYKQLSGLAHVPSTNHEVFTWSIKYKDKDMSGYVDDLGVIETKGSSIKINGDTFELNKKSMFSTREQALKNINILLEKIIKNINNNAFVTKNVLGMHCFPRDLAEKFAGIN